MSGCDQEFTVNCCYCDSECRPPSRNLMGDAFNYPDSVVKPAVSDFAKSMGVEYPYSNGPAEEL